MKLVKLKETQALFTLKLTRVLGWLWTRKDRIHTTSNKEQHLKTRYQL